MRTAATEAIGAIAAANPDAKDAPADALFARQAEQYFKELESLQADPREDRAQGGGFEVLGFVDDHIHKGAASQFLARLFLTAEYSLAVIMAALSAIVGVRALRDAGAVLHDEPDGRREDRRDHRLDDRVGAALAKYHAEGLVGHRFQVGKQPLTRHRAGDKEGAE